MSKIKPFRNISILTEYNDMIIFKHNCSCGCDNNSTITVTCNKDLLTIVFYVKTKTKLVFNNFFKELKYRIKSSFNLLFYGFIETESDILLGGQQSINDFIKALQYAKTKLIKNGEPNQNSI